MHSVKRRRTSCGSSASSRAGSVRSGSDSPRPHKSARRENSSNDKENNYPHVTRKPLSVIEHISPTPHGGRSGILPPRRPDSRPTEKKPYEYICFNRPLFDVDGENWRQWSEGKAERLEKEEMIKQVHQFTGTGEEKSRIWAASPSQHKDHKWVIMWSAWSRFDGFCRRAKYCDPNKPHMQIYTDWEGWGMQDIIDNTMVDFDKAFQTKDNDRLDEMWAIISAVGLWANVEDVSKVIENEDPEKTCKVIGLLGCALLTILSEIDRAGELNPSSRFLDIALVIGYFLELSHDLPAYGIEGSCVSWRKEAVLLFKKGKLDPKKSLFDTDQRLAELDTTPGTEHVSSDDETEDESGADSPHHKSDTEKDSWTWSAMMADYKEKYGEAFGLQQYDIATSRRTKKGRRSLI